MANEPNSVPGVGGRVPRQPSLGFYFIIYVVVNAGVLLLALMSYQALTWAPVLPWTS